MSRRRESAARIAVALTAGDPSGVGPEILACALADPTLWRDAVPLVFADERLLIRAAKQRRVRLPRIELGAAGPPSRPTLVPVELAALPKPGSQDEAGARFQRRALELAADAVAQGSAQAMVTGPVSKAQIASTGLAFAGHTEWLAERFGAPRVVMMLAGPRLRVALATTHVPIGRVAGMLARTELTAVICMVDQALREKFGVRRPRIAVTGLNPHAGESGRVGREEVETIGPAVEAATRAGVRARGPFSADGLFPRAMAGEYDAVLAMYHDQGMVPVKLVGFRDTVNVTLGLPFVRTSPDHGVAYDLAGKGTADPSSMRAAVRMAIEMTRRGPVRRRAL